jgi:hypothetical protein
MKKIQNKMIYKLLLGLIFFVHPPCIKFSIQKKEYSKKDKVISIVIKNCSNQTDVFYKISLLSKTEQGWIKVISDIDNLNRNEITHLVRLEFKKMETKKLVISKIPAGYFKSQKNVFKLRIAYSESKKLSNNNNLSFNDVEFIVFQ